MLPQESPQKPWTGSPSFFRRMLVGGCVVLLLVVLSQNVPPKETGNPKIENKQMMIQEDSATYGRACVEKLTEKMNNLAQSKKKVLHLAKEIPSSAETKIATVNGDGTVSKLAWNDKNLRRMSAQYRLNDQHKFIDFPATGRRMVLYSDNTVVDLDTRQCVVVGVFEHAPDGEIHPLIRAAIKPQMGVARDKGSSCRKKQFGRCYKDGQYCRDEMHDMNRGSWIQPNCPSGWKKDCSLDSSFGCTQPQYSCGCGTSCRDPVECDALGNRGKFCTLSRDQCDLVAGLGGAIGDTSTVVGNIQTAVDIGAALISLIPGGGAVGVIGALFGFAGNLGMTGEGAYNAMLDKLKDFSQDVIACMDIKITEEIMRQIATNLITMEDNMDPQTLDGSTPEERIEHTWNKNTPRCVLVGSHFETIKSKSDAYQILPLGLTAAQLCMGNYIGLLADLTTLGKTMSILVVRNYRTMFKQISESISSVIGKFYDSMKGEDQCGYFTSDKKLLSDQKNYLTNNVLANVNKLKDAFNLCPGTNFARGKTTFQSSTAYSGSSSRAVDGNRNTVYRAGASCTHTVSETNAYWAVDLGGVYEVCSVKLTNRGDCCSSRLSNFDIFVADNRPTKSYPSQGSVADTCVYKSGAVGSGATETFTCTGTVTGRYVSIRLRGKNPLTLCEVEVFGRRTS